MYLKKVFFQLFYYFSHKMKVNFLNKVFNFYLKISQIFLTLVELERQEIIFLMAFNSKPSLSQVIQLLTVINIYFLNFYYLLLVMFILYFSQVSIIQMMMFYFYSHESSLQPFILNIVYNFIDAIFYLKVISFSLIFLSFIESFIIIISLIISVNKEVAYIPIIKLIYFCYWPPFLISFLDIFVHIL